MAQDEIIFLDGFTFKRPAEGRPSFVKGTMGINVDRAIEFLQKHKNGREWLNAELLTSKDGKTLYWKLDTWEKPKENTGGMSLGSTPDIHYPTAEEEGINPEDVVF